MITYDTGTDRSFPDLEGEVIFSKDSSIRNEASTNASEQVITDEKGERKTRNMVISL